MKTALYPGSFDPVTVGHAEVIARAARLFDRVVVGVLFNPDKAGGALPVAKREELLREVCAGLENVEITAFPGLLVEAVRACGADVVVRGLRTAGDAETELQMARVNRHLDGVETLFLASSPETVALSSSIAREVARFGGSLRGIVPECVREKAERWLGPVSKS